MFQIKESGICKNYKKLPKSCYKCSLLQLEPVINLGHDPSESESRSESKNRAGENENQHKEFFERNNHQLSKTHFKSKQQGMKNINSESIARKGRFKLASSLATPEMDKNNKGSLTLVGAKDTEGNHSATGRELLLEGSCQTCELDVDFDSDIDCLLLDMPESSFIEEINLAKRHERIDGEVTNAMKQRKEVINIANRNSTVNLKQLSKVDQFSNKGKIDIGYERRGDVVLDEENASTGEIFKANTPVNINTASNKTLKTAKTFCKTVKTPEVFSNPCDSMQGESKTLNIQTPRFYPQPFIDSGRTKDVDDDIIITKTVYKGKEIISGMDCSSNNMRYVKRTTIDSKNESPLTNGANVAEQFGKDKRNNAKRMETGLSDMIKSASNRYYDNSKRPKLETGECPLCSMRFPPG